MPRTVRLEVNGVDYGGWENVSITKSIEAIAAKFTISVSDLPTIFPINPGDACKLYADGQKIIDGYVDTAGANIDAGQHGITISGRDKTCDLVDCAATNPSQEFLNISFADLLTKLAAPFGIAVKVEIAGIDRFPKFSLQQETAFEAIERACRLRGVLPLRDGNGGIKVVSYGQKRATGGLILGENVKSADVTKDFTDVFSEYTVYGQQPGSDTIDGETAASSVGKAYDSTITRFRPCTIVAEGAVSLKGAQDRAEWEAAVRSARSTSVKISVAEWFQNTNGDLWDVNLLVPCDLPALDVAGDLLIKDLQFDLSPESGSTTLLTLTKKDAYLKQPDQKEDKDQVNKDGTAKKKKLSATKAPTA